ncbi:MAG TPA: trypsin-like peptidase domain-containing protein, partial [Candidatus Acidoferrum sp.]|nr:trypsin-like peptidase domain-containing protein [Candidatus Acidoferrum sp.]
MSARLAPLGLLLAVAALAYGGCGGNDSGGSGSVTTVASPNAPQHKAVVVQAHSGAFDPEAAYQEAAPGVVTIRSIFSGGGLSSVLGGGGGSAAQGSGFVISSGGEIATNAHVVTDATGGGGPIHEAKEVYVQFADRNQVAADIVGFDPNADVALLKVDSSGLDLHPLQLATNEQVEVGQPVAAIGSPFGEDRSLSVGVVSATDRSIQSLTRFQIEGAIQTDASINPGNSGGPLLDADGNVIGINQQINTTSGGNEGVGFAVPIGLVAHSLDQLRANGSAKYAYIGVTTQPLYPQLADRLGLPTDTGALIAKVVPGGPADHAGLRGSDQK